MLLTDDWIDSEGCRIFGWRPVGLTIQDRRNFARAIEAEVLENARIGHENKHMNAVWNKTRAELRTELRAADCRSQNAESERQDGLSLTDATQKEAQEPVGCLHRDYTGTYYVEPTRPDIARHLGKELFTTPQPPAPCPKCRQFQDEAERLTVEAAEIESERDALQAEVAELEKVRIAELADIVKQFSAKAARITQQDEALKHSAMNVGNWHRQFMKAMEKVAELEAESAENCRIVGMSGEREARHLARIAELEKVARAYEDQVAAHNKTLDELARKVELIDEQKGTIRALNMALGGDGSTSTENLIDANEFDAGDKGLIALCREQAALIEKCDKALRLVQKYAPITLDCEAFHHPKSMQHDSESTCEPAARYYHALNEVGEIIAAIANQKGGTA